LIGVDIVDNTLDIHRLLFIAIGASTDDDESSRCLLMAASKTEGGGDSRTVDLYDKMTKTTAL
jgi:hypothetical protein